MSEIQMLSAPHNLILVINKLIEMMKKIAFVVIASLYCLSIQAQTISTQSPISRKWMGTAKKISREEFAEVSAAKFKKQRDYPVEVNLYQEGDVLVALVENKLMPNEVYSFEEKLRFFETNAQRPDYKMRLKGHEIKKVDGRRVLVVNYELDGDEFFTIFSEVYDGNKYLFGHLQYPPSGGINARATLSNMLTKK